MAIYKTIGFMEVNCKSFSETWFRDTQQSNLEAVYDETLPLWQKRAAMLGKEGSVQGFNVSFDDVKGDAVDKGVVIPGNQAFSCAAPVLTVFTVFRNATNVTKRPVYLRGFDDNCEMEGGKLKLTDLWLNAANPWADAVIAGQYGWMHRTPAAAGGGVVSKAIITGYTADIASHTYEISFAGNLFPLASIGENVRVYIKKVGIGGQSRLNGMQVVIPTAQNQAVTATPMALFPFFGPSASATRFDYVFTRALQRQFKKIGRRAPGNCSRGTPGRASVRPKG